MPEHFRMASVSLYECWGGTMLVLNQEQRELLADKLLDAANLAVGGMVFAQFVTGEPFSLLVAPVGIVV
jgi:hypothetical protein